jgi:hypothetical protein
MTKWNIREADYLSLELPRLLLIRWYQVVDASLSEPSAGRIVKR